MTQAEALEKVRKLLALAEGSSGPEAASAAAMAQKIMTQFDLEEGMLDSPAPVDDGPVGEEPIGDESIQSAAWKGPISHGLAVANQCRTFWRRIGYGATKKRLIVVGRKPDQQRVTYMYQLLVRTVESVARRECRGMGRAYYQSFRFGMAEAIRDSLLDAAKRAKEEAYENAYRDRTANPQALVRVDRALARVVQREDEVVAYLKENFRFGRYRGHTVARMDARAHGYQEGQKVDINSRARAGLGAPCKQIQ